MFIRLSSNFDSGIYAWKGSLYQHEEKRDGWMSQQLHWDGLDQNRMWAEFVCISVQRMAAICIITYDVYQKIMVLLSVQKASPPHVVMVPEEAVSTPLTPVPRIPCHQLSRILEMLTHCSLSHSMSHDVITRLTVELSGDHGYVSGLRILISTTCGVQSREFGEGFGGRYRLFE